MNNFLREKESIDRQEDNFRYASYVSNTGKLLRSPVIPMEYRGSFNDNEEQEINLDFLRRERLRTIANKRQDKLVVELY